MGNQQQKRVTTDTGPFSIVPHWLVLAPVSDRAVRLYALLARYADNATDQCWPARQTLADAMGGCSLDSVDRAVRELVQLGALDRQRRSQGPEGRASNLYTLRRVPPTGVSSTAAANPTQVSSTGAAQVDRTTAALTRPSELDPTRAREGRPRDKVWDAVAEVWGAPATKAEQSLRGQVVRDLRREGLVDPVQLVERGRRARQRWEESTPRVLLTRWSDLAPEATTNVHDQVAQRESGA